MSGRMFEINHRDILCIGVALAFHSLLFLWKGGMLTMPDAQGEHLGDILVEVRLMDEVPGFDAAPAGGSSPKRSFLSRMKSIIKREGGSGPKQAQIAAPEQPKIDVAQAVPAQPQPTLSEKTFMPKDKGFSGVAKKNQDLTVATGKISEIEVKPSAGNFKSAAPNLKENNSKVAIKDAPFAIRKPRADDALANANMIPIAVGKTTSANVKALDGGQGSGPALQSKTFASSGGKAFKGSGFSNASSGSTSGSGSGGLAGGSGSAVASIPAGSGAGTGIGNGSGNGVGNGSGSPSGTGTGFGSGKGNGYGSGTGGRTWGGTGTGFGGSMQTLPRNHISGDVATSRTVPSSKAGNGFNITGPLANRPILSKSLPPYERDARVALRFRVDWAGKVIDGVIVEISSGSPSFDNKVVQAIKQWKFSQLPGNRTTDIQEGVITFVFKGV